MHQDDDCRDVDRYLRKDLRPGSDPAPANGEAGDDCEYQVAGRRRGEDRGVSITDQARFVTCEKQGDEHQGQDDSKYVQRAEHTPRQVRLVDGTL